jgi:hypothetical protein
LKKSPQGQEDTNSLCVGQNELFQWSFKQTLSDTRIVIHEEDEEENNNNGDDDNGDCDGDDDGINVRFNLMDNHPTTNPPEEEEAGIRMI